MSLGASKVTVREGEARLRQIQGVPTAVTGAIGIAERGPIGVAVAVDSPEEYEAAYGGFTQNGELALFASNFFDNGGGRLWVVRTAHYTDVSDPDSLTARTANATIEATGGVTDTPATTLIEGGPWFIEDGDELKLSVDGRAEQTLSFEAKPAELLSVATFPTGFSGGEEILFEAHGVQSKVAFEATDRSPEEVAARLNAQLRFARADVVGGQVRVRTDVGGSFVRLQVLGGTANDLLKFPANVVNGSGNVEDQSALYADALAALLDPLSRISAIPLSDGRVSVSTNQRGPNAKIEFAPTELRARLDLPAEVVGDAAAASGTALTVSGSDPGEFGNRIQVEIRESDAGGFDLLVFDDGAHRETFSELSMDPTAARHVEAVVNGRLGSRLIQVFDHALGGSPEPGPQTASLSGGSDGLVGLDDGDFVGSEQGETGLRAFDAVSDLAVLTAPGRATPVMHQRLVDYCERIREGLVFAILDPPAWMNAIEIEEYVTKTALLSGLSESAAIYWPRLLIRNPKKSVFGALPVIAVSPSGAVAGVFARTDTSREGGVYIPPAGVETGKLVGVLGFESQDTLNIKKRDRIYPKRINPLTSGDGFLPYIDGSRTLKGDGQFPYVAEKRGVIFIRRSVKRGLQFARHRNNTESLRAEVDRTLEAFLLRQMRAGAFRSQVPEEAFFVDVSDALNPPSVVFQGKLRGKIGVATNKPAEFIEIEIAQDTRALEAEFSS